MILNAKPLSFSLIMGTKIVKICMKLGIVKRSQKQMTNKCAVLDLENVLTLIYM
jgi:hypothetical protein